jgi:polyhydroxyalkanoic acid synthase PhaR subunit
MPDNTKSRTRGRDENIFFPDFIELWKKVYFKTEESYANISKEFISSNSFVQMLDQIRDQYLSNYKLSTQNLDKYFEINPIASKKDIARVAELVIALEDKLDNLDFQFADNLNSMAKSHIKLADHQQSVKNELLLLKQDISVLNEKLDNIGNTLQSLPQQLNETKAASVNKKKSRNKNAAANEIIDERRDLVD